MREFVNSQSNRLGMPLPKGAFVSTAATTMARSNSPAKT